MAFDFNKGTPVKTSGFDFSKGSTVSDIIQENNIQKDKKKSLMEKLGERAGNIVDIVRKPQDAASILTGEKNIQIAGQVAGGVNDVIGAGLGWAGGKIAEATPTAVKEPIKSAGVAILQSSAGQAGLNAIKSGADAYNSWKQANPRIAQDLEAVVNIASLLPVGKAGQAVKKTVLETNVAKNYIKQQAEKTAVKTAKEFDDLATLIVQGKTKDIPIAQKALSNIDISNIKTAKDAVSTFNGKIETIASKLDDALLTDKTLRPLETLKYKNHNFVDDALRQLSDFYGYEKGHMGYKGTNNIEKKAVIDSLIAKAKTEGLTVKEINDIARLHGQDLNAFNANRELASGLTKIAAENTRTGVKNTAKTLFNNPVFDAADKEMSSLIRVRDLFKKQIEEVNKLQQKIMERSLGEKVGRMAAKVFNTLGGNAPKGAVEFFLGRGTGLKTINALDWEKMLQKNLQKLQKIAGDKLSDKQLIKELEKIVNDLPSTPPILPPIIKSKTSPLNLNKEIKPTSNLPQSTSKVNTLSTLPIKSNPLIQEAKKYKTAEEFVKAKKPVYHGSRVPLKSFSNKKGGVYFTEEYADATGFAGSPDNVYEGYLNFKKPLEIDAKGAKWDKLNTKYGKSTQEVISNAQKDGYDGVVFKNIVDNAMDTAGMGESTIYYAYKPKDAFINESQLTDIWNKANKKK